MNHRIWEAAIYPFRAKHPKSPLPEAVKKVI